MFYGISQCGTRHPECVLLEESRQRFPVTFTDFAQHPSDGFVDQIVRMRKKFFGQRERIGKFTVSDKRDRRNDRDALLPQTRAFRHPIQDVPLFIEQIQSDDRRTGQVYQIPVVRPVGMLEVERVDFRSFLSEAFLNRSVRISRAQRRAS